MGILKGYDQKMPLKKVLKPYLTSLSNEKCSPIFFDLFHKEL